MDNITHHLIAGRTGVMRCRYCGLTILELGPGATSEECPQAPR